MTDDDRQRLEECEAELAELRDFKRRVLAAVAGTVTVEVPAAELEEARAAAIRHGYFSDVLSAVEAKVSPAAFLRILRQRAAGPFVDERYRHQHPEVDDPDEILRPGGLPQ